MKILSAFAAIGVGTLGFAGTASAYKLIPAGSFTGFAHTAIQTSSGGGIACTIDIAGKISKSGIGQITQFTFVDKGKGCKGNTASGLPWKFKATGEALANISAMAISGPKIGSCGPATVSVAVGGGEIIFGGATIGPNCIISGVFPTTPPIDIAP